jgi:hypothetical protein
MAEWQPPRAIVIPIPALLQNPVNLQTFNRLEDAIELATYFVQESEGDIPLAHFYSLYRNMNFVVSFNNRAA